MNVHHKLFVSLPLILLLSLSGLTLSSQVYASDKDRSSMMRYRNLFMETKGKHAKAIKLLIKSKLSLKHIITHGEALAAMADDMLILFPAGTAGGKSRVTDNIWDKNGKLTDDFVAKVTDMRAQAREFVRVAKEGDYKKIKKQMGRFANKGCRSCHTDYRGEEFEPKKQ